MFVVKKIESIDRNYDGFVLLLNIDGNIFNMMKQIERELNEQNIKGKIVIDQYLFTDNNFNRFIECNFNSKFDFTTANNIEPYDPSCNFRLETFKYLYNHCEYMENSILTDEEKELIKNGIAS